MPYLRHVRITASGVIGPEGSAAETWSCNLTCTPSDPNIIPDESWVTLANAVKQSWATFQAGSMLAPVRLDAVRLAEIGTEGRVLRSLSGAYRQWDSNTAPTRSGLNRVLPYQIAWVQTLQSAFPGRNGRGRFYVPQPVGVVGNDGKVAAADTGLQADRTRTLIDAINADLALADPAMYLCVASQGSALYSVPPGNHRIEIVECGDVLDTQRRRRSQLEEVRAERAVA